MKTVFALLEYFLVCKPSLVGRNHSKQQLLKLPIAVLLLSLLVSSSNVFGQGTVAFLNNSQSLVTSAATGTPLSSGDGIRLALYYADDGITDEASFVQIGLSTGIVINGRFNGGTRTVPTPIPGGWAMIQVRAFEAAYGSTYEEAFAAPPQNGRFALTGKSEIMRVNAADPTEMPPGVPVLLYLYLHPFSVAPRTFPLPQLAISDALVFEGDSGTTNALFEVTLAGGSNLVVSVDFATADNTATAGSDYAASSGTLIFDPGESSKTIVVPVYGDTDVENDEVFGVNLSNPVNAVLKRSQAAGTIYNDDCRTSVALALYPGVTINGCAGKPYQIQVAFDANPNQWSTVTNFILPTTPYLWFDTISPISGQRFYRTVLLPP